ncbi:hypothetical protein MKEN_00491700 [Mycena kentingensis (nom. inval.)]|nr:hypothetical protein MKEN_00491700 [Mycena kentingensis (nom. inval.)]
MRIFTLLLGLASIATMVYGRLVNITLEDTSPQIIYTVPPLHRCPDATCDAASAAHFSNGTSATAPAMVIIPFSGSAIYVHLGVNGSVFFQLDGVYVGQYYNTDINDIAMAYNHTSGSDGLHVLTIIGITVHETVAPFQIDYVVYTTEETSGSSNHTTAIVGGVLGGLAFIALAWLVMVLVRRKQKKDRKAARGSWFRSQNWKDKPSIQMEGLDAAAAREGD